MADDESEPPADGGLALASIFLIPATCIIILAFLILRQFFGMVYWPAHQGDKRFSVWYQRWFCFVFFMGQGTLLRRSGMLASLFVGWKTMQIVCGLFLIIFAFPVLVSVYYTQGDKDMNWFSRCAASSLDYGDGLNWLVFSYAILYTVLFVAMIVIQFAGYVYAKNYQRRHGGVVNQTLKVKRVPKKVIDESIIEECVSSQAPVAKVNLAWNAPSLHKLQRKRETFEKELEYLMEEEEGREVRPDRCCCPGWVTCRRKVVGRAYYQRKLDELKVQIDPKIENKTNHHGIAFITFEEPDDAERLSYKWKGEKDEAKTKRYVPKMAAHPQNIHWDNLGVQSCPTRFLLYLFTYTITIAIAFLWAIPLAFLTSFPFWANIPGIGVGITALLDVHPFLTSLLELLVPAILMSVFNNFILPYLMYALSLLERHHADESTRASAANKIYLFVILNNVIFILVFTAGVDTAQLIIDQGLKWTEALGTLNWAVQGAFFMIFFYEEATTSGAMKLIRIFTFLLTTCKLCAAGGSVKRKQALWEVGRFKFFEEFSIEAMMMAIFLGFGPIVPWTTVFAELYFISSYLVMKYLIVATSAFEPDATGKMMNRFFTHCWISQAIAHILWIFYFFTRGPFVVPEHGFVRNLTSPNMFSALAVISAIVFGLISIATLLLIIAMEFASYFAFVRKAGLHHNKGATEDENVHTSYRHPGMRRSDEEPFLPSGDSTKKDLSNNFEMKDMAATQPMEDRSVEGTSETDESSEDKPK